jgi:prepilin peptidase CpaA
LIATEESRIFNVVLLMSLAVISAEDIRHRRVPNLLVAVLLVEGLVQRFLLNGFSGLGLGALGVGAGAALLLWQYRSGLMGAGDVKLLGAIGAWAGPRGVFSVFLIGSALGGILSVVALLRMGKEDRRQVLDNVASVTKLSGISVPQPSEISRARGIPYGVSLSLGAVIVLIGGVQL